MKRVIIAALITAALSAAFIVGFTMKTPYDGEVKITRISKISNGPWQVRYEINGRDCVQNFPTKDDADIWIGK